MKRNLVTIALIALVLVVLVALNLVFLSGPRGEETEQSGDRSSYKGSPYGTLAYYRLLEESGHAVARYEEPYTELEESSVATLLVVVPHPEHQPSAEEFEALESWVLGGGRLVVVDREISLPFVGTQVRTGDRIEGEAKPAIPSTLTRGVRDLDLSRFATTVSESSQAATVHFAASNGPLLIEMAHGAGSMLFLSEPYLLQNNGIAAADNLALALNLAEGPDEPGTIAFDEYHHGYGAALGGSTGGLRGYIAGTPIPWIILQLAVIGAAVAFTAGRRFGRPIPVARERRTSALEFVGSMATIQRLARASDLAVENIYTIFRARLARYVGLPSDTPSEALARAVSARGQVDADRLLAVMRRCEAALAGSPPAPDELLRIVEEIRRLEGELKL